MKFKLLKDLPWAKAGTEIEDTDRVSLEPADYPNWFQPIDGRWRPEEDDDYFFLEESFGVDEDWWMDHPEDHERFASGNCFRTEADAQLAADRIKSLLTQMRRDKEID